MRGNRRVRILPGPPRQKAFRQDTAAASARLHDHDQSDKVVNRRGARDRLPGPTARCVQAGGGGMERIWFVWTDGEGNRPTGPLSNDETADDESSWGTAPGHPCGARCRRRSPPAGQIKGLFSETELALRHGRWRGRREKGHSPFRHLLLKWKG